MIQGTTKEIGKTHTLNGVVLEDQEWYTFIRVLERCGIAAEIGKQKHAGAGRQSKVFQIPEEVRLNFTAPVV